MVVEPTKVRVAEGGAGETAVELHMATRERRQVIVGEGIMILAGPVRIKQKEVMCGEYLQKGVEGAVAEGRSHIAAGNDTGTVVGGDLVPADSRPVRPVSGGASECHRRLPEDQQCEGQEHYAAPGRQRRDIFNLEAAKVGGERHQSSRSSTAIRRHLYRGSVSSAS